MTRDEAAKIWADMLHPDGKPRWSPEEWSKKAIDCYAALGMLKLDEPKSTRDKFCDALKAFGYHENATAFKEAVSAFDHSQK